MMTRGHLQYKYVWAEVAEDSFDSITSPIHELNKENGPEMLRFINSCAQSWGFLESRLGCKELEIIIQEIVPGYLSTCMEVRCWIEEHYRSYLTTETTRITNAEQLVPVTKQHRAF